MEDNTGSRVTTETRRKSMEDNTRPTESESKENILDEGDDKANQEPDVQVQPEPVKTDADADAIPIPVPVPVPVPVPEINMIKMTNLQEFRRQSYRSSQSAPSFFGRARQRTPHKMINLHVGATNSSQSVPCQNIVLVRPRTLGQTNPKEHNGPVPMEGDEEIFEEKAVCKNCFHNLKEENILKTECKCGNALIHEECAAKWSRTRGNNNCDSCGQEVQTFPVTLVRGLSSSTQVVGREESNKWSMFSRLMRIRKA